MDASRAVAVGAEPLTGSVRCSVRSDRSLERCGGMLHHRFPVSAGRGYPGTGTRLPGRAEGKQASSHLPHCFLSSGRYVHIVAVAQAALYIAKHKSAVVLYVALYFTLLNLRDTQCSTVIKPAVAATINANNPLIVTIIRTRIYIRRTYYYLDECFQYYHWW